MSILSSTVRGIYHTETHFLTKVYSYYQVLRSKLRKNRFSSFNGIYLDSEHEDCRNKQIMFAMQQFILNTKRFEKPS